MTETEPTRLEGTVTFLFTDIEGSTRLEGRVGRARYAALRERHRELLRTAWADNGGREVSTEGDSFFVVFKSARAAVAAAIAGQRAIAAEPWPDEPVRVRMGLHTGEYEEVGGSAVGLEVNEAARIAAAAHGGQILASAVTGSIVQNDLPADTRLIDLGEYRLRDLQRAQRLMAIAADGLQADFPPPRTPDARPNNLPTQLTTFVGRDAELAEGVRLLGGTRLLTLTGPGGTGKTRLGLQLAAMVSDGFPDGVFFVPLEPIRDRMLVAARIASAIGVAEGARPIGESVAEWLHGRRVLLVLDNFEQVLDAAPVIADLLRGAPGLTVIVTSRAALHVSGEQEYPVPGLPVPPDPSQASGMDRFNVRQGSLDAVSLGQYAAVRLFIERALAVRPGFAVTNENAPAVAAISARLQGMPLAIELAAARIRLLSPDAILSRLEHQLDVLAAGSRDLPERQQTLRGAIAWSYDLLEEGARLLLDRLSIFVGGFDLEAAEAVGGPASEVGGDLFDGISALVDQSLVKSDMLPDGEPRFRLLESIRAFAEERLAARDEVDLIRERHRAWFVAMAASASPNLSSGEQRVWLDRLELAHDDIRTILDRAVAAPDPPTAISVAFDMWRFWQKRGHLAEARRRLEAIAAAPWSHDDPRLRARLCEAIGGVYWWQGEPRLMGPYYNEALAIWQSIGDDAEIANAEYNAAFQYAVPELDDSAQFDAEEGLKGLEHLEAAREIYHRIGDRRGEANTLWGIGNHHYFRKYPGFGNDEFRAALGIFRDVGDRTMEAWSLHMLGTAQLRAGELPEARESIVHALRHFQEAGDAAGITLSLDDMSAVAVAEGDLPRAARLRGAARNLTSETGATLAAFVEDTFETGVRPGVKAHMTADDLARYGAEGAAMPLDEAVAYALGTGSATGDAVSAEA